MDINIYAGYCYAIEPDMDQRSSLDPDDTVVMCGIAGYLDCHVPDRNISSKLNIVTGCNQEHGDPETPTWNLAVVEVLAQMLIW